MKHRWLSTGFFFGFAVLAFAPASSSVAASLLQTPLPAATAPLSAEERGDLAMVQQNYTAAIEDYSQIPVDAVVLNKIGVAYHHMLNLDLAVQYYQKALSIRPDYPEALNNLGAVYYARGDYKRAIRFYKHALKLMPHSAVFAANLGTAYFARRNYEQGINAYRDAFTLNPAIFNADSLSTVYGPASPADLSREYFCIAELLAEAGMKNNAILYLRKSLDEGFKDRSRLLDDDAFAHIRQSAEFAQLLNQERIHN